MGKMSVLVCFVVFCGEEGWFGHFTRLVGFCLGDRGWNLGPQQGELGIVTASLSTC